MNPFRVLGKNPFTWFYHSTRSFGLAQTLTVIWSVIVDSSFDLYYGTDTVRRVARGSIEAKSENVVHSSDYGASKAMPFMRLMRRLNLPKDSVFVDLGSGKGRALMLAAKYGFRKVVGVEFSGVLCDQSRINMEKFMRKCPSPSKIEIIESDVAKYHLNDDETVFFMFDPFNAPVLTQVLQNIGESVKRKPRSIWLIYGTPREQEIVARSGVFTQNQRYMIIGVEFRIFSNEPVAGV
jgi:SAM-dependent methyltransferase